MAAYLQLCAAVCRRADERIDEDDYLDGEVTRPVIELEDCARRRHALRAPHRHSLIPPVVLRGFVEREESGEHRKETLQGGRSENRFQ